MATTIEELNARLTRVEAALERLQANGAQPRIGKTIEEVRRHLAAHPEQEWTDEMWDGLMALAGIGEGPPDLAERSREYLRGDRA